MTRQLIVTYRCEDVTGIYNVCCIIEKRMGGYVAHYPDFPNISSIARYRHQLDYWCPAMLVTMLAEESGIVPRIKLERTELIDVA